MNAPHRAEPPHETLSELALDSDHPPSATRLERILLVAILAIAACVRFYDIAGSSLWSDEGNTWALIQRSVGQIARDAAADIHPPGYYWLLKLWATPFGADAAAMRSLSALLGLLLVYVIYRIGIYAALPAVRPAARGLPHARRFALLAALIAALNPFQIYYSQEARMYMLLALAGAGLFWALLAITRSQHAQHRYRIAALGYLICGVAGLWTHYSFPAILAAAGTAYLIDWLRRAQRSRRDLMIFAALNAGILIAYLPWVSTAITRTLAWPRGSVETSTIDALSSVASTMLLGPLRNLPDPNPLWLLVAALLPLLGLFALRRGLLFVPLLLWSLMPLAMMFGLGLFSDAFLKFLLVASPVWTLLVAAAPSLLPRFVTAGQLLIAVGAFALAVATLPGYYADPTARDNYAGVARYIAAAGDVDSDLVLLNAPGQREVWDYYDPGLPVLALPNQRPPDPEQAIDELSGALAERARVFALFWATDESDPDAIVESWLNQHAFKGLESWQGNLRFVTYSLPTELDCRPPAAPARFGNVIELAAVCQDGQPQSVAPGDVALLRLLWRTDKAVEPRYKVTVQLLDSRNQVIAQRDGEPAGGSRPTDGWQIGEQIEDNHGLTIPPGTPPGDYRLIAALYDADTGARLPTDIGNHVELGVVEVGSTGRDLPLEIVPMQHRLDEALEAVTLAGYDVYKRGASHAPQTPIAPGDLVHYTFYWQAPADLPEDWAEDAHFELTAGAQSLTAPLAGGAYPTGRWSPGQLVRGEFDILYDGSADNAQIRMGIQEYILALPPGP